MAELDVALRAAAKGLVDRLETGNTYEHELTTLKSILAAINRFCVIRRNATVPPSGPVITPAPIGCLVNEVSHLVAKLNAAFRILGPSDFDYSGSGVLAFRRRYSLLKD